MCIKGMRLFIITHLDFQILFKMKAKTKLKATFKTTTLNPLTVKPFFCLLGYFRVSPYLVQTPISLLFINKNENIETLFVL